MPSIITHYLCGAKTWDQLLDHQLKDIISQNRSAFNLGTQGPDILFYYRVWPWTNNQGINKIGEAMHEHQVNSFFSHALQYIIKQDTQERNMLTAYLCGYICHYALDCLTHPYIFYKTGFNRPGEHPTSKFTAYHRTFETALDVLMLQLVEEKRPLEMNLSQLLQVRQEEALLIGDLYHHALRACGLTITPQQTSQAIQDMLSVQHVLRDHLGMKKLFLSRIEKILGLNPLISSMIYPQTVSTEMDYLNLSHNFWSLPWDPINRSTTSFPEMFDQAVEKGKEMITLIPPAISGRIDMGQALEHLGNRSFSTGLDCCRNVSFTSYDCIFDRNSPSPQ